MKIYIFNPDTDMALAHNEAHYMAPSSIRGMEHDLALLPIWYARCDTAVLAPSAYNARYLQAMQQLFRLPVRLVTEPELASLPDAELEPWGWNPAFRKRMLAAGVGEERLWTQERIALYRECSSRAYALAVSDGFEKRVDSVQICGRHILVDGAKLKGGPIPKEIADSPDGYLFKSVWSSSGKGLRWCLHGFTEADWAWCLREVEVHKSVILEPIYKKVGDFAMEFFIDEAGKVSFCGYSHFVTDWKGAYQGNLLEPDEEVERWILQYVPQETLVAVRRNLQSMLEKLYGGKYTGHLGVDMMVCPDQGGYPYAIHPHVEVNLRMTMGMVAQVFYNRFVACGSKGIFRVDGFRTNEALQELHTQNSKEGPLVLEAGKIVSGYLPLVPVTPQSRSLAYVKIEKVG